MSIIRTGGGLVAHLVGLFFLLLISHAFSAEITQLFWDTNRVPIAFKYDSRQFNGALPQWPAVGNVASLNPIQSSSVQDPVTGLHIKGEATLLPGFEAIEWVWHFQNRGTNDTPILED